MFLEESTVRTSAKPTFGPETAGLRPHCETDGSPPPLEQAPRSREQGFRCCSVKFREMSVWVWIAIGVSSFFVLSLSVGLAVAAVLGDIGRRVSELYETEDWAAAPPSRRSGMRANRSPKKSRRSEGASFA